MRLCRLGSSSSSLGCRLRLLTSILVSLLWLACFPIQGAPPSQNEDRPDLPTPDQLNVKVIPGGETIKLDGILDEEVWGLAEPATKFWQLRPQDRTPATERTEVRIAQDEQALYFGIMCFDSNPDGIIIQDMRRDAPLSNDDYVGLYLDTYHDHRNFYYFSTNAAGTRRDGIVTDARSYNTAWNGIWQAKARITEDGWSAEYRIPFSTLRFGGEQPMTWGFNISRAIRQKQESVYWAPIARDLGRYGTWRGEFFGQLVGIETSEAYRKWEAEPYLLVGGERRYRPESSETKFNVGGDLSYDFTPNLRGDLSIHTDFAQVEADQEVINFTRFPLFFPEKREFFLENGGLFHVGYEEELLMFYSRRIGLSRGQEVPILLAGKLSGRAGPFSLGVMNVQTAETDLTLADGSAYLEPSTNYSVVRVKRDIFSNSSFGAILTNKQVNSDDYNRLIGFDGNFWFTSALKGEALLAKTFSPTGLESDILGVGRLLYAQHNIVADLRHYSVGPHFVPEMGFVLQNDLRRTSADLGYTYWINGEKIRNINFSGGLIYSSLYNHDFFARRGEVGAHLLLESNDKFGYIFGTADERVYEPFTVGPITIQPGDYTNPIHSLYFQSDASRPISLLATYGVMDYWGGDRQQLLVSNNFHPTPNLAIDLIYTYNTVDHPEGAFNTTTISNRILYAFTTDLFVKSYIQWNNLDNRFSANFLLGWEYRPGSDLYLVYNEIRDRFDSPNLAPRDRILMLKLTYNFRF